MTRSKSLTLILAATNPALGIGKNGALPWRLKREMKFFREVTNNSVVVMGRKTWESIPPKFRPLANRVNIVVSSDSDATYDDGVIAANSLEDALEKAYSRDEKVFIIGGSQLYTKSLQYATRILLTLVEDPEHKIECDTFFKFDSERWKRQPVSRLREVIGPNVDIPNNGEASENGLHYAFTLWEQTV